MKAFFGGVACICALIILAVCVFIWSGVYNVAADVPHWGITFWLLDQARSRSVAVHSSGINPPPLNDKKPVHEAFPYFQEAQRTAFV